MLRSRIIPSLLIKDGGLVKSVKFRNYKYVGDPLNAVKIFNEKEVDELMIYDIDASTKGNTINLELLKKIAKQSRMPLCYGGGINSEELAAKIISLGFEKISLSTSVFKNINIINKTARFLGSQSVVITIDVKKSRIGDRYQIYTNNGKTKHKVDVFEFCKRVEAEGAGEIILNSIDRDGTYSGYDLKLAREVRQQVTTPITFLGGAGTLMHMSKLINEVGVVGAAAGSLFVFNGRYKAVLISYDKPEMNC